MTTDPEGYRVVVFASVGEPLAAFGQYRPVGESFGLPVGIAVDTDEAVWVTDAGNLRVGEYEVWKSIRSDD